MKGDANETKRQPSLVRPEATEKQRHAHAIVYLQDQSLFVSLAEGHRLVLGRAEEADVVVETSTVSRRHAALLWQNGQLTVEDCGSTNGTYVDGRLISEPTLLTGGEDITIGEALVAVGLTSPARRRTRLLEPESFDLHLRHELQFASNRGRRLTLVRLKLPRSEGAAMDLLERIVACLPERVAVTCLGPREYLAAVPDTPASAVRQALLPFTSRTSDAAAVVRIGLAEFPRDGQDQASLMHVADSALEPSRPAAEAAMPEGDVDCPVAVAPLTQQAFALARRFASTTANVLLVGETGVGKDLLASEIHRLSGRNQGPLIHVNCGAIPSTIFEREMFGHERGAFTGARERQLGLFEAASGGTLFLDEVGEIPLSDQAPLLRAIEHRTITRVGGVKDIPLDIRLVAATNRDLNDLIAQGLFRQDLLYRLNVLTILVPALRDRRPDIGPLARRFAAQVSQSQGQSRGLTEGAIAALESHNWPGNVRELRNVVERALLMSPGPEVTGDDVLTILFGDLVPNQAAPTEASLKTMVELVERQAICRALDACGHNQTLAARQLDISRRSLIYKMQRYGIPGRRS